MRRSIHLLLTLIVFLLIGCNSIGKETDRSLPEKTADQPPNIIIILADDLGYSDLGCYGGEIHTPSLDKLAREGLRFTQFYNTSRCCPTRASLLTGLYPHQAGVGRMTMDAGKPGYRGFLTDNTVTIAEVLKKAGYHTGMVGKWHVSLTERLEEEKQLQWLAHQKDYGDFSDTTTYPTARGFEKYYGNIWGVVDYFDPFSLVNGKEPVKTVPDDYYHTIAIGDSAVAYVEQFSKDEKPFFLYVAHTAPHWPLQALPEDIKKYEDVYKIGWDSIRHRRYERMIDMGLLDNASATLSAKLFPELAWNQNKDRAWDAQAMAVHAAMVDRMDKTIGKLMDKLEATGEMDNTLIIFLSDNGASYERPSEYGPGFDRAGSTREGEKVIFPVNKEAMPGPQTVYAGIGPVWANVANTPFRYYKSKVYEGGIATPFIVHWPAGIQQQGTFVRQPGHVIDLMATCLQLANAQYPKTFEGHQITPTPGKSLLPAIQGEGQIGHNFLFWEHFGSRAIRQGDWKLVRLDNKSVWELYNLAEDRTETKNLAAQYPEKVAALKKLWQQEAEQTQVFPMP